MVKSPPDFGSLNGTVIAVGNVFAQSTEREATMRAALSLIILFLGTVSAGCASRPSRIALEASPRDFQALVGTWRGSYKSSPGRHGLIDFTLDATNATAYGDVFMMADDAKQPYASYRGTPPGSDPGIAGNRRQILSIRFVRIEDGRLQGTLAPYWDPDRGCEALATFYGRLESSAIEGTFVSVCDNGVLTRQGRWSVTRQRR